MIEIEVRRNCSNVSCQDFGRVLATDISGPTVARSEMKAGSGLIASARLFYQNMHVKMNTWQNETWGLVLHAYRQDCTNGHRKVCVLELQSAYAISNNNGRVDSWDDFQHIKRLSDLVQIGDESGAGCIDSTLKSFKSLGAPSWRDVQCLVGYHYQNRVFVFF